ncbi:hypothetical protein C0J52_19914 [Blattella germanica]|nr:hypothetical protein C0J52_19914 [Blattella germanica]
MMYELLFTLMFILLVPPFLRAVSMRSASCAPRLRVAGPETSDMIFRMTFNLWNLWYQIATLLTFHVTSRLQERRNRTLCISEAERKLQIRARDVVLGKVRRQAIRDQRRASVGHSGGGALVKIMNNDEVTVHSLRCADYVTASYLSIEVYDSCARI